MRSLSSIDLSRQSIIRTQLRIIHLGNVILEPPFATCYLGRAMKRLFLAVLLLVTSGIAGDKQPFTIALSADKTIFRPSSNIWITVTLTNNSNQDLDDSGGLSDSTGLDPNFQFEVRDQGGHLAPKRIYPHPELATGKPLNRTLRPGESVTQDQRPSALYDISKPGAYTIQVSMPVAKSMGSGTIKSNVLTITVSENSDR